MKTFFNENGLLNLDETVMEMASFKKIMEDGIVTNDEIVEQTSRITAMLHQVEDTFSPEQTELVKKMLAELSVLYTVYHYKELQSLR